MLKLKNNIFKILIELFIFNKKQRMKVKSRWAKKHLKKYVDIAIKQSAPSFNLVKQQNENQIFWQYWHQGEENAPLLIKKCLSSVKKYHSDKQIVVLNYENIKDYIDLPSKYYDMVNQGKMKLAFFSDILRTYLLCEYGGVWVDSTIYLTDKIPRDILESRFFVLSKDPKEDWMENRMSNFFIRADKNCKTMECIKNALDSYWDDNDFVINYFMYEHMMTILSKRDELKEEWEKMPVYSAEDTGILQKILFEEFNQEQFEEIKSKTNIHKLSYKILKDYSSGKSYYDKIIRGEI